MVGKIVKGRVSVEFVGMSLSSLSTNQILRGRRCTKHFVSVVLVTVCIVSTCYVVEDVLAVYDRQLGTSDLLSCWSLVAYYKYGALCFYRMWSIRLLYPARICQKAPLFGHIPYSSVPFVFSRRV